MTTLIAKTLAQLFGVSEKRAVIVGLGAAGKTTVLYMLKLGEVVTTIPTIGFNVETVSYKRHQFTFWDVGGCDKIRPLWRHYFQNTQLLVFVIDSSQPELFQEAQEELWRMLNEEELRGVPLVVLANKQDLPKAASVVEIQKVLRLDKLQSQEFAIFSCVAITAEGLVPAMDWMIEHSKSPDTKPTDTSTGTSATTGNTDDDILTKWLSVEDEPDDTFLEKLHNYTLDSWDHRTHLRLAWLLLTRHDRREGMKLIFSSIKAFIQHSPRTSRPSGTTFHETMTYFWTHMVHYAMKATKNPTGDFKTFLLMNPQLSNSGLFLHYYSKKLMLDTAESRTAVALPDKRPLPSLLTDVSSLHIKDEAVAKAVAAAKPSAAPLTDEEFLAAFESRQLSSWSHESLIRLIFVKLVTLGRRQAVDSVVQALRSFQGEGFHMTITYFWLQMVTYVLANDYGQVVLATPPPSSAPVPATQASASSTQDVLTPSPAQDSTTGSRSPGSTPTTQQVPSFHQLLSAKSGYTALKLQELVRDPQMYMRHYSKQVIFDKKAEAELVLPDKKPLPNLLQR